MALVLLHNKVSSGDSLFYLSVTCPDGLSFMPSVFASNDLARFTSTNSDWHYDSNVISRHVQAHEFYLQEKAWHGGNAWISWRARPLPRRNLNLAITLSNHVRVTHIVECVPGQAHRSKRCPAYSRSTAHNWGKGWRLSTTFEQQPSRFSAYWVWINW